MTTLKLQKELPENCFINKLSTFSQTNCGAAYGLRLLVNSYTGPIIQIRRSDTVTIGNYTMSNIGGVSRILFNTAPSANFQIGMTLSGTNINNSPVITSIIGFGDNGSQIFLNIPQTFTGGSSSIITGTFIIDFFADVQGNLTTSSGQTYSNWLGVNTGTVVTWYDQSGNNRHVSQTTVSNQPSLTVDGNMTFNGTSSQLSMTSSTNLLCPINASSKTYTLLANWSCSSTTNGNAQVVVAQGPNTTNNMAGIFLNLGSVANLKTIGFWGFSNDATFSSYSTNVSRKTVMMCNHNNSTGNVIMNDNATIYTATTGAPGSLSIANTTGTIFSIGSNTVSNAFSFQGTINEVIIFNNTLTTKESQLYYIPSVITKARYFSTPKIQIKGVMKTTQSLPITQPKVQIDAQMFNYLSNGSQITTLSNFPFGTYTTVQEGTGVFPIFFNSSGGNTAVSMSWSISGTTLTITTVIYSAFCVGMTISGTGITTGTRITAITSGGGGAGTTATLSVSHGTLNSGTLLGIVPRNAKSVSWSVSGTTLTLTTVSYGLFEVGMTIYGPNITGNPTIISIETAFGGNGTSATLSVSQSAITSSGRLLVGNFSGINQNMILPGYIHFNGNNSVANQGPYLTAGSSLSFNIGTNNGFTSIAYIQFTSLSGAWQRIYEFDNGTNASDRLILSRDTSSTRFRVEISNGLTNIHSFTTSNNVIVQNRWMMVVVRYTYANSLGFCEILVNGIIVGRNTNATAVANRTITRSYIGRSVFSDNTFQGNMTGLYMYDSSLTDNQIANVSNHLMYSTNASIPMTVPDTTRITYTGNILNMGSRLDTAMFFNGSSLSFADVTDMPNIPMSVSLWFYSTEPSSPATFQSTITNIATGTGSVVLTLSGGFTDRHVVGMSLQITGSNSVPNIDGTYTVTAINSVSTITISTTVLTAGSSGTLTAIVYKPNVIYSLTDFNRINTTAGGANVVLIDPRTIRFNCSNNGTINNTLTSSNVIANAWNHIVISHISGGQWAYLNGTYIGQVGGGSGNVTPRSNRLIIGADNGTYTASFTGSITNDTLTVTALSSGQLYIGMQITGSTTSSGTVITSLVSGYGGIGTYFLNKTSTVTSTTLTGTYVGFNGYISDVRIFDYALSDTGTWNGAQLEVQYLYTGLDKKLLRYEDESDYLVTAQELGNKTANWWSTMIPLSTGGATLTYTSDPNPRVIGNLLFNLPGTSYWYQQVAIQKYNTFIFAFDINISGVLTGDFISFFCGGTQPTTLAGTLGQNNAFVVLMQVTPNPSYISNANTQGIYLLDNTGTVVASYAVSNWITIGQYIPVTITYTKGQIGTWVINYNGLDIINYSHPNNSSWVNTSGNNWGISAYSNEGTLNNATIRKLEMVYSDKSTSSVQTQTQKIPPANMTSNDTTFPGVSYYNGLYSASSSANGGSGAPFGAFTNSSTFTNASVNPFNSTAAFNVSFWESAVTYNNVTGLYTGSISTIIFDCSFQITSIPTGTGTINILSNNTLTNGQTINIISSNCIPNINGTYTVSSVSLTQFSITVSIAITTAGTSGSYISVNTRSITGTSGNGPGQVTVTTNSAHNFVTGQRVTISGNVNINGTYTIYSASGSTFNIVCENTFTGSQTTGTVTANSFNASGEWLQLQVPNPISVSSFAIKGRPDTFYAQRCPRYFILAGSNDNITWYALHVGAGITNWTVDEKTFTCNQNNTNSYYYLRLVTQVTGNDSTNWTACNVINIANLSFNTQLNIFSKNSVPAIDTVSMFMTSSTFTLTANNNPAYNGTYTASASVNPGGTEAYRAFRIALRTDADAWITNTTSYSTSYPYAYTGSQVTSVGGTNVSGDWIQLQVPTAIVVTSFILRAQYTGVLFVRAPSLFLLVGSNDNSNWNVIHRQTQRVVNWNFDFKIFSCNQNDRRSYRYFRLIITNLFSNGGDVALSYFNLFTNAQRIKETLPGLTWKYYIRNHDDTNSQETKTYANIGRTNSTSNISGNTAFQYPRDTQNNYTIEQTGYFVPKVSGFYIFYGENSDDVTYMWIGNNAYSNGIIANANLTIVYNNLTIAGNISCQYMYKGVYYPIKTVFGQIGGGSYLWWYWGYCNVYGTSCTISGTVLTVSSDTIAAVTASNWTVTNGTTVTINTGGTFRQGMLLSGTNITGSPIINTVSGSILTISVSQTNATYTSTLTGTIGISSNNFRVGQNLAGPGIIRGTTITSFGTGTGGPGTYNISISHTLSTAQIVAGLDTAGFQSNLTGYAYTSLGTNSAIPADNAKTIKDLTGTNQDGVYYIKNIPGSVGSSNSATISGTVLTAAGTSSNLAVGQLITGTGSTIEPNTYITSLGTGTGGNGTYNLSISQTVSTATQIYGAGHSANANFSLPTFCLMNDCYDGGGWMMLMKSTNTATFQYSSTHWTTNSTLRPTDTTRSNADAKFDTFNYQNIKDVMVIWPDIPPTAYANSYGRQGGSFYVQDGWVWLLNSWYNQTTGNPYNKTTALLGFQRPRPVLNYTASVISPVGINNPFSYSGYGFGSTQNGAFLHYINSATNAVQTSANLRVRWGLLYNNDADHLTGDSYTGIGMNDRSAGDDASGAVITGINRFARMEMYGRN